MQSLVYLNKYLLKYKRQILTGLLFVIFGNIFALFPANLIGKSFDLITHEINNVNINDLSDLSSLYYVLSFYAGLLIVVALIRGVFMFYMRQNIIVASRKIEFDLKNTVFQHYQHLSSSFYKNNESGDLLNRLTEDVSKVRMYLGPAIMYAFNLFTLIILILSRMLIISPVLTMIVLLPLPLLSFLIYKVSHRINFKSGVVQHNLSMLTNVVQETFSGIRLVKSFVREQQLVSYFNKISKNYMNVSISLSHTNSIFFPLVLFLVGSSILLTVYVGGVLVSKNHISIGEVAEFIIYVNMLTWPVTSIGWVTEVIQRAAASQSRINEFLDIQDQNMFYATKKHKVSDIFFEKIYFSNLSYKYLGTNIEALKSINLEFSINQVIGLVGHVGSGKTTIIQIMCGILKPSSGELLFDNCVHTNFNWHQFREDVSYVSQDVFLFSQSIRNNILFGQNNVSQDELMSIVRNLCLLQEVESFKDGLDTFVGEGGITLSGGQKQRIALARALIRKPKFLFLDDALSSVDSSTELKIINFIKKNYKETTIVLSSNRLSTLYFCTNIIVLNSGRVIQQGNHQTLINTEGEYRKLFFNQMDNE